MIKLENTVTPSGVQWRAIIRGMRNPLNSWDKSDSKMVNAVMKNRQICPGVEALDYEPCDPYFSIGPNDHKLMMKLRNAGSDHRKFMRMIVVYVDITAPLYWWKEFDTYKIGTVANSCSTMHKIHARDLTLSDFSTDHLDKRGENLTQSVIDAINLHREGYVMATGDKEEWYKMIQLLPTSYNQKRTVMMNYEVLANIYKSRKSHKLDEWREFCKWIETLPYSELITGEGNGTGGKDE